MSRNRRPTNRRGLRRPLWRVVELTRFGPVERQRGEHHDMLRWYLAHEFALRWNDLLDEARQRTGVTPVDEVIGSLEDTGMPVIIAESEDEQR